MTHEIKQFTVADPRTFDGDPFEVAERAVRQAEAVAGVLVEALEGAKIMTLNAEMERQLQKDGDCDATHASNEPSERKLAAVTVLAENLRAQLEPLARAAGYNPRKPAEGVVKWYECGSVKPA